MKTQEAQVIMLPTDKSSRLCKNPHTGLMITESMVSVSAMFINQHLYFINDKPIKEDDNIYNTVQKTIFIADKQFMKLIGNNLSTNKKIIATTNPDLWYNKMDMKTWENTFSNVHKIDTTFIEVYVREQGKINTVLLEYEQDNPFIANILFNDGKYKLKLKPNGSVIVHPVKEKMYSKEEVKQAIIKFAGLNPLLRGIQVLEHNVNEFIEQHL